MAEKNIDSYVVENEIVIEEPRVPQYTVEDSTSIIITNPFRATSMHQEFHLPDRPRISASSIGPVRFSTPADIGQPIPKRRKRTMVSACQWLGAHLYNDNLIAACMPAHRVHRQSPYVPR